MRTCFIGLSLLVAGCAQDVPPPYSEDNPQVFKPRYDVQQQFNLDGEIISRRVDVIIDAETGCEYLVLKTNRKGDSITARIGKDRLPICNPPKE